MDPVTEALQVANAIAQIWLALVQAATPEQKQAMLQPWIDNQKWWSDFLNKFKIGG